MEHNKVFFNGKFQSPSSNDQIALGTEAESFPRCNIEDSKRSVHAAKEALPTWTKKSSEERTKLLHVFGVEKELLMTENKESSKSQTVVAYIGEKEEDLTTILAAILPSMENGCTAVVVPSPSTVLAAFELCEKLEKSELPAGVFNMLTGDSRELREHFESLEVVILKNVVVKSQRRKSEGKRQSRRKLISKGESGSLRHLKEYSKDLKWNFWNRWTYAPASKMVMRGNQEKLTQKELWNLPDEYRANDLWEKFEPHWNEELKSGSPSLFRATRKTFGREYYTAMLLQFLYACTAFANPIVLPYLLRYIADKNREYWLGIIYVAIIVVSSYLGSIFYYQGLFLSNSIGLKLRTILIQLVYRKVLRLGSSRTSSSGQVVNLVANDTQFVCDTLNAFTGGLIAPIQIIITIGLLWQQVEYWCFTVIGVMIVVIPISGMLGGRFKGLRIRIQAFADKRLKLTNELISGIRIVKFYAWEKPFLSNIDSARILELNEVRSLGINRAYLILITGNITTICVALTFFFYTYVSKHTLTPGVAFATLALLNLLRFPLFFMSFTLTLVAQYKVTFQRIQAFLSKPEIHNPNSDISENKDANDSVIYVKDGLYSWESNAEKPVLQDVNLNVVKGKLVMVIGAVGSGKSTIVQSILGEVPMLKGLRYVHPGSVSYVAQEAWIFNATLRENIVFGLPFDEEKYQDVIDASALGPDLIQLPNGDQTEIGERGITLSGGQKQRVSIARALYSDNDIFILDDPFSAVDAHVGKHLFQEAIQKYLKGKTIILSTNQLQYLPFADTVILMKEGKLIATGRYSDLMASSSELRSMMKDFGAVEEDKENEVDEKAGPEGVKKQSTFKFVAAKPKENETKESGLVSWRIYWHYIKCGSPLIFLSILVAYCISTTCAILSSWWLSEWSKGSFKQFGSGAFIGIYVALLFGQAILAFVAILMFAWFSARASYYLHSDILQKVVRAPTSFFDVTPLGRIINRFAKELSAVDAMLPIQLTQLLNSFFQLIAVFAAMMFASYWIIFAIVGMVVFYGLFQWYYRHVSVELQRLEALSRAPIFSHLSETISGVASIRAYQKEDTFIKQNVQKVDLNCSQLFALRYCASWFGLLLDVAGGTLVLLVLTLILILRNFFPENLDVAFAGLTISYSAGLTLVVATLNLTIVETETRMNSVERLKEYEALPQEAPSVIAENRPPEDWPSKGQITFKDYSLAYRQGENVLKGINVTVKGQDKIGIVGRTGAGKSSMMVALFRMVEPSEGTIEIDGIDITTIGLDDLRSKLSIIPQEPTLFIGTVRYNLDPFGQHDDKDIWDALRMVRLEKAVSSLTGKLDEPVAENGGNFSVGERQLICMARALLRKSKILLMDEATASVDLNTDTIIQKMVRENFKDFTVLTIAHRLNTIMDSTKVMVLDKGKLAEFDKPSQLLERDGIFSSMVDASGPSVSDFLRKIARGEIDVVEASKVLHNKDTSVEKKKKKKKKKIVEEVDSSASEFSIAPSDSEMYDFIE